MFHQHHILVFALARLWNERPTLTKLRVKRISPWASFGRNLKACPPKLRETAYFSLVRSSLEYSSAVWDPFRQKDIDKLEKIQRAAAALQDWADIWGMCFNPLKCSVLRVSRPK